MRTWIALSLVFAATAVAQLQYTKDGQLVLPKDYRQWIFLSSSLGLTYPSEGTPGNPVFTNVFANPAAYNGFLKAGIWPDKTMLLMEVRSAGTRASINKDGRFQTDLSGFDVHVKDSSRGGWAFYFIRKDAASGKRFPATANYYSCHDKNAATDTTFVQFYPTLIETSKKHGTFKDSGE